MINSAAVRAARRASDEVKAAHDEVELRAALAIRDLRGRLGRERAVVEAVALRYQALGGRLNPELWERAVREVRAVADGA